MIAFGIDPGSRFTGWGVVRLRGSRCEFIDCGVLAVGDGPLTGRLSSIFDGLNHALNEYSPNHVFLESIFHHKNARSALVLGHARGVAMLSASLRQIPVDEISPAEVKKAVSGRGRAEKAQVQEMVRVLLGLPQVPQEDAADALAVAIAGSVRSQYSALTDLMQKPRKKRAVRKKR